MSIIYKSRRIGKNEKEFWMYKFKTLKDGTDQQSEYESKDERYTFGGKFLRKFKLDELPQLWNLIKGDMWVVGPRPEEKKEIDILPEHIRKVILSVKPGLTSLSSIYFFNEEDILKLSEEPQKDFWTKIKPMKIMLDVFYVNNKCLSLDLWIVWQTFKQLIKRIFGKV